MLQFFIGSLGMTNFHYQKACYSLKDEGYSKIKLLSEETLKKSPEKINNIDIITGGYMLKELLEEVEIIGNPQAIISGVNTQNRN